MSSFLTFCSLLSPQGHCRCHTREAALGAELRMGHLGAGATLGQVDSLQPRAPSLRAYWAGLRTLPRGVHTGTGMRGARWETCPRRDNRLVGTGTGGPE